LPGVFDACCIAPEQHRHDVVFEVRDHGEFATVERCIAEPADPLVGDDLERDEIAPGTRDDDARALDLHGFLPVGSRCD